MTFNNQIIGKRVEQALKTQDRYILKFNAEEFTMFPGEGRVIDVQTGDEGYLVNFEEWVMNNLMEKDILCYMEGGKGVIVFYSLARVPYQVIDLQNYMDGIVPVSGNQAIKGKSGKLKFKPGDRLVCIRPPQSADEPNHVLKPGALFECIKVNGAMLEIKLVINERFSVTLQAKKQWFVHQSSFEMQPSDNAAQRLTLKAFNTKFTPLNGLQMDALLMEDFSRPKPH
jgi:hypothetical protein